jgi:hypothetical protein
MAAAIAEVTEALRRLSWGTPVVLCAGDLARREVERLPPPRIRDARDVERAMVDVASRRQEIADSQVQVEVDVVIQSTVARGLASIGR